ncbi:MAG: class II fructose-bisphosphate aldolase [Candidatus Liptonbacteria bacterium]|nr:class II fructose-bisphosphate aldolase [Candidatus Liptonbacteria bacterium]
MLKTLKQHIAEARDNHVAIGHFNISDLSALKAIFGAAKDLGVPVIIGVSEGERDFIGVKRAVALVRNLREEYDYPIFINADHTYSFEKIKEAVAAGFDSVIFDGAKLPFEENVRQTKKVVQYVKSKVRGSKSEVLVEGELGYIGSSSKLLDVIPEGAVTSGEALTKPEEAKRFVAETGVHLLAPAVGNLHGMLKNAPNPRLNIPRIKAISEAVKIPLVLHGGSGISDNDFMEAAQNGTSIIHINTEIRIAWREALESALNNNKDEIAPYKILAAAEGAVKAATLSRLKLFSGLQ